VRELAGPPDAPVVLLLHGWTATADLNFFRCYFPLAERHRVVAVDHRGHGRGIRTRRAFRLEDCADDADALCEVLGIERVVAVGYSMGGPVAQLLWRRHPGRVQGLVLCATAAHFADSRDERTTFRRLAGLAAIARLTPPAARTWLTEQLYLQRKAGTWEPWALREAGSHDWRAVLEAGREIGRFSSRPWLAEIDVPTSDVVTTDDHVVPLERQLELAAAVPGAHLFRVEGDHDVVVTDAEQFVQVLQRAVDSVVERGRPT
jgi:3-oxoadipate enol-lactonase